MSTPKTIARTAEIVREILSAAMVLGEKQPINIFLFVQKIKKADDDEV